VSLTSGRGPLASHPAGVFVPPVAGPRTYIEPFRRRVRGLVAGVAVVDSDAVLLLHRPDLPPGYAFPDGDVSLSAKTALADVAGYVTVPWDAVDTWIEEEEPVVMHPRNPYHRVDCLQSRRRLRVEAAGLVVVDTDRTVAVYETALEPRLYVSPELVTGGRLEPSATVTYCRYKGHASYWTLVAGETIVTDAAWSYEHPLSESAPIAGLVSFDDSRVSVATDLPGPVHLPQ
jgi:uncharacterized protein (DUF427 family)